MRAGRADYERLCALAGYAAADGQVPTDLGPGATRLLERFPGTPMLITDAAMNLVAVNSAFLALEHWNLTGSRWDWNVAWRQFCSPFEAFKQPIADVDSHEAVLVAQLRAALLRYPADGLLAALVDELRSRSRRFDTLWRAPRPLTAYESSATFTQPDGDSVTLLGNLIAVPGDDLAAVMLTAPPGSRDSIRLEELVSAADAHAVIKVGQPGPG